MVISVKIVRNATRVLEEVTTLIFTHNEHALGNKSISVERWRLFDRIVHYSHRLTSEHQFGCSMIVRQ